MSIGLALKILAGLVLLVALIGGVYAWILAQRKKAQKAALARSEGKVDPVFAIQTAFEKARTAFAQKVTDRTERDKTPRYLALGEPSSGKTTLLGGSGMSMQLIDGKDPLPGDASPVNVWLLAKSLVIDVSGSLLFGEDGIVAPEAPFKTLLNEVRKLRRDRPIDGIILTVPCGEILKTARSTPNDRKRKATILRNAIAQTEQTLGMNVPVYVVVTHCDLMPGFRALVTELNAAGRDDILGWSSPYPPFTENSTDWVEEAFDSIRDALIRHQARRFATGPVVRSPDEFFLFPNELASVSDGLRSYVDPVFLETAGQETLTLRGIYFCGAADPPADALAVASGNPSAQVAGERKVFFSRGLFESKVFAEKNLGKPAAPAVRRRDRMILALHVLVGGLAALLLAGLWIHDGRVAHRVETLMPLLRDVQSGVLQAKAEGPAQATFDVRKPRALALLQKMETMEPGRLRSILNPASLWSRMDGRVDNAFHSSFERVIVDTFQLGLAQRANEVIPVPVPNPDLAELEDWLTELSAFEASVARYDSLIGELGKDGSTDVRAQSVADLSTYVLGYKLSPTIPVEYYRVALARGALRQPFELRDRFAPAAERATSLFEKLRIRVLDGYSAPTVLNDVALLLSGMQSLSTEGANYKVDQLWELHDSIGRVETHLTSPTITWVTGKTLPSNEGVEATLKAVRTSRLLGPTVEAQLRKTIEDQFGELKRNIVDAKVAICNQLLERKDKLILLKLSPCILALKTPIGTLRQQAFMTATPKREFTSELAGKRLDWDVNVLKEVSRLPKEYEALRQTDPLKPIESELIRNTLADLSVRQLKTATLGGVAEAARDATPLPGSSTRQFEIVRGDVANLAQASAPLRDMIGSFVRLRMDDARDSLRDLLRTQGKEVLGRSAEILRGENLYGLKRNGFTWWDGKSTPAYEAFSVPDAGQLTEYAVAQRTRAATLHKELAEPLLVAMQSPEVASDGDEPAIATWQSIGWPLEDYENKKAGNGVSTLETFILTDLPQITAKNCLAELDKRESTDVLGGFFSAKQRSIAAMLRDRCRVLSNQDMRDRYAALRRAFNRELSGKFPFVKIEPGIRVDDASPDAVRRFLTDAADFRSDFGYVLAKDPKAAATGVGRFLEQVENVRAFMMPMWANAASADDGIYDVKVEFRINPTLEVGGNRIAEWALRLGDERLFLDGPKPEASWRVNDPVRVELRWAKTSNDVPDPNQGPNVTVSERRVTFEEKGPWALLRMIAFHQTASRDAGSKTQGGSHTLGFVVQSKPDSNGEFVERIGSDANTVRVFIGVTLTGVEKDRQLRYPEFPHIAPNL